MRESQRRQKFGERGEREGRRTAFQSGFLPSHFLESSVLCTASVSPLAATRTQSLTREKCFCIFPSLIYSIKCVERLCGKRKGVGSLGKEDNVRGEEQLFKAVFSPRIFLESSVLCTASVSPLDLDKDTVLDPRKMLLHFSVLDL